MKLVRVWLIFCLQRGAKQSILYGVESPLPWEKNSNNQIHLIQEQPRKKKTYFHVVSFANTFFGRESHALTSADTLRAPRLAKPELSWPQAGTKPLIFTSHCGCLRLSPMLNRGESMPPAMLTPQSAVCSEWCIPGLGLLGKMIKVYGWWGEEFVSVKETSCHLHRNLRCMVTGLFLGLVAEPRNPKARRIESRKDDLWREKRWSELDSLREMA